MYEKTITENVELQTQLRSSYMDNDALKKEIDKVRVLMQSPSTYRQGVCRVLKGNKLDLVFQGLEKIFKMGTFKER